MGKPTHRPVEIGVKTLVPQPAIEALDQPVVDRLATLALLLSGDDLRLAEMFPA